VYRGSTVGQLVRMIETEYTSRLSTISREKYDEQTILKFKEFVKTCEKILSNPRISPSQADKVMSYKLLIEREIEWYERSKKKST
jgi:hypothetical protein